MTDPAGKNGRTELRTRVETAGAWRIAVILLTALVGCASTGWMYVMIGRWQAHLVELRFINHATRDLEVLNGGVRDATDLLYSLRAFFESRQTLPTRAEYERFSAALRQRVPGLRDTGWAPLVTAAERAAFEQTVGSAGTPAFRITQFGPGGLIRAGERDRYFPILYSDPGPPNRPVMGFDVASEPHRRTAIEHAVESGEPAATAPLKLANGSRPKGGFMSFVAVSGPDHKIAGVILGAFETTAMIRDVLTTKVGLSDLDFYIYGPSRGGGEQPVYYRNGSGKPPVSRAALRRGPHWFGRLRVIDQTWDVIVTPARSAGSDMADFTAIAVLAGGLTATLSLVAYLGFSLRQTRQLERLAAELRQSTQELQRNGRMLNHLAHHDTLTGLANRVAFMQELHSGLHRVASGEGLALLYLDLDRFKAVNDTLGHPYGDKLLCAVAGRLRDAVRESDVTTRLGGDEFAIAQSDVDQPAAAEALARRLVDWLSEPYDIGEHRVLIGVSVGIVLASHGDLDADEMLRRADIALYAAKQAGRGTWRLFEPAMESNVLVRQGLETELRRALERQELSLVYLPYVQLSDGRISAFEALLRWRHPERGMVMPGDFLGCAEETGLSVPIGAWVLRNAMRQAASWPAHVRLSVNLSWQQLRRRELAELVESLLTEAGLPAERLELDITENALVRQDAATQHALARLREIGVGIAVDDFGTGEASLSHLRRFQFDRIKLDGSFVAGLTESRKGRALVLGVLQLASSLGIATTAEGVEMEEQGEALLAGGCDEAQGFLFCAPVPPEAIEGLLADWPAAAPKREEPGLTRVGRVMTNLTAAADGGLQGAAPQT